MQQETIPAQELIDGFLFSLEADGKAASTRRYYEEPLRRFLAYASERGWAENLASITIIDVRSFLSHASSAAYSYTAGNGTRLTRHGRQGGAWQYFRALRRFFNWAVEEGIVSDTPMRRIRCKPPRTPRIDAYSLDAISRFLSICDLDIRTGARFLGLRNRAMLLLFLDGAFRRAEMASLNTLDVQLQSRRVTLIGKGDKPGTVPFCAKTAKAISLYLLERKRRARCVV